MNPVNPATRSSIQMFGAYCGLLYMLSLLIGWWLLAGFLPPIPATADADQVAALFQAHPNYIRAGMVIVMYAALAFIPFAALITYYMSRIEGGFGVLSGTALLGGAGNMVLTFYPAVWWLATAFRPERSAEITQTLNDLSWLQFIGGVSMFDAIPLAIAVAAFCDKSPNPVFPRWAGFCNLAIVFLILPDQLIFFFHSGPFAWTGLFGLWIPLGLFTLFFVLNFVVMRKAILRERGEGYAFDRMAAASTH